MEASYGSFVEERQPPDRRSTFREATRQAQEKVAVENSLQELRSNLAALNANNDLLRRTLKNQDSLWSLQRLDSVQSQNVELTRSIKSLYTSLAPRITHRLGHKVLRSVTKDICSAVQDFRVLLLELVSQLQGEISGERHIPGSPNLTSCITVEDEESGKVEEKSVVSEVYPPLTGSFKEPTCSWRSSIETDLDKQREVLQSSLQNTKSNLIVLEEFLGDLNREKFICFNTGISWSQVSFVGKSFQVFSNTCTLAYALFCFCLFHFLCNSYGRLHCFSSAVIATGIIY